MNAQRFIFTAILILCGTFSFAEVIIVEVTITLVDSKRSSINAIPPTHRRLSHRVLDKVDMMDCIDVIDSGRD
jgi:hypothetical protein